MESSVESRQKRRIIHSTPRKEIGTMKSLKVVAAVLLIVWTMSVTGGGIER